MSSGSTFDLPRLAAGAKRRLARLLRRGRSRAEHLGHRLVPSQTAPLFVHFGTHKTGSSSIQQTLYDNSGSALGYDYPDLGAANGSFSLSLSFCDVQTLVSRRLVPAKDVDARRIELERGRLETLLASAPRALPKVLSAEAIAHFKPDELAAMDQFVSRHWPDRIYLGYVREPVSFLRSAYQEVLKTSNPRWHLVDREAPPHSLRMHAHEVVDRLDQMVGRDRVRAFAFDRDSFPGGDVVRHFLQQIGARDEGIPIRQSNEGMSLLSVKLLYQYRTRKAAHDRDIKHPGSLHRFVSGLTGLGAVPFDLHPDLVRRIVQANRSVYDWSAARLDRPLVPPPGGTDQGVRALADLDALSDEETALFAGHLTRFGLSLPAQPDGDAIAEAMQDLRLMYAADAPATRQAAARAVPAVAKVAAPEETPPLMAAGPKPRLYLHIGMGKTGTTSIQQFAWENRARLEALGLTYPGLGVEAGAHHRLSPHVPPFLAKTWDFIDPADWAPKLAAKASQPILVSSELMASADRKTAKRAASILNRHFDVRVLIYVRRIDDSIMATFNQNVKAGTQRLSIEDALPNMFEKLRIDRVLGIWTEAFGGASVIVRPYDRSQFAGGDILQDVCKAVGLAWSDDFVLPRGNPNARLGRAALEFKRCLNIAVPDTAVSQRFNPALLAYSAAQDTGAAAIFHESDLLPGAVRRVLIARQEAFYRDLADQQPGLDGSALFSAALPGDDLDWVPLDLTAAAFAELGQAVLTPDLRGILARQITDARQADDPQRLLYAARFLPLL